MSQLNKQVEPIYQGPWAGIDVSVPETDIPPNATPFCNNVVLRLGEIRSRVALQNLMPAPQDGTAVLGTTSFIDSNSVVHTVAITQLALYQLSINWPDLVKNGSSPWLPIAQFGAQQAGGAYEIANLNNKIYFSNGGNGIWQWDGISNSITNVGNLASGGTFGAVYLMELNARLVAAYTIETGGTAGTYPFRVRWSAVSLASNTFDPLTNFQAGFNDEFDTPDSITGLLPIGRTGYVFRTNGITEMIPGNGSAAFIFDHLWASDRGIGAAYPQSVAGYGPMGIFVSGEDVYKITPNSFDAIGGKATDSILNDLANANGVVEATILPYFTRKYPFTCYVLIIGQGANTRVWIYNIKENHWHPWTFINKTFSCTPKYLFTK